MKSQLPPLKRPASCLCPPSESPWEGDLGQAAHGSGLMHDHGLEAAQGQGASFWLPRDPQQLWAKCPCCLLDSQGSARACNGGHHAWEPPQDSPSTSLLRGNRPENVLKKSPPTATISTLATKRNESKGDSHPRGPSPDCQAMWAPTGALGLGGEHMALGHTGRAPGRPDGPGDTAQRTPKPRTRQPLEAETGSRDIFTAEEPLYFLFFL